jgi:hypothetical protein
MAHITSGKSVSDSTNSFPKKSVLSHGIVCFEYREYGRWHWCVYLLACSVVEVWINNLATLLGLAVIMCVGAPRSRHFVLHVVRRGRVPQIQLMYTGHGIYAVLRVSSHILYIHHISNSSVFVSVHLQGTLFSPPRNGNSNHHFDLLLPVHNEGRTGKVTCSTCEFEQILM